MCKGYVKALIKAKTKQLLVEKMAAETVQAYKTKMVDISQRITIQVIKKHIVSIIEERSKKIHELSAEIAS